MLVAANGTTLYVDEDGEGPPLVFVHGMCGDADVWCDQVQRLRDRFHCISYDRRGHSRSPRTAAAETVGLHADDLAALVDSLGIAPCVVVGSSGGARVVVDSSAGTRSTLVRRSPRSPRLAPVAPEAFSRMIAAIAPRVREAAETGGPRAAVDAFFEVMCPGLWQAIGDPAKDRYRNNAAMLFADLGMPPYEIAAADIRAIDVPTLMIRGTTSFAALRSIAETLADWLPHAELLTLDCGHVTYAEKPVEFAAAVETFASKREDG